MYALAYREQRSFLRGGSVSLRADSIARIKPKGELIIMKANHLIQCGLLACLLAAQPASAKLKIIPVFIGGTPPPAMDVTGGGNLQEIFQVAAESWERVFKNGGGNWTVTIYYGWTNSFSASSTTENSLFAQEKFIAEGGHPGPHDPIPHLVQQ